MDINNSSSQACAISALRVLGIHVSTKRRGSRIAFHAIDLTMVHGGTASTSKLVVTTEIRPDVTLKRTRSRQRWSSHHILRQRRTQQNKRATRKKPTPDIFCSVRNSTADLTALACTSISIILLHHFRVLLHHCRMSNSNGTPAMFRFTVRLDQSVNSAHAIAAPRSGRHAQG